MLNISFTPEPIFHIGSFVITNSLLVAWIGILILFILCIIGTRKLKMIPSGLQALLEYMVEALERMVHGVTDDKEQTKKFFPFIASIFVYLILLNWMEVIPGFSTIGIWEVDRGEAVLVPFFRAATADLNLTIAMAVISVLVVQVTGIAALGFFKYAGKFITFRGPMAFIVGILELISEVVKIISFSFRLFGNLFAGEVLLIVMTYLVPFVIPMPFIGLEIFVGFIQALVFAMLTLVFLKMATQEPVH